MSYLVKNKIKLDFSARKIIVKGRSINFESRKANCNSVAYTADGMQNVENLITAKQFSKLLKKQDYTDLYSIQIVEAKSELNEDIHAAADHSDIYIQRIAERLKHEYNDIFTSDLPPGLPPERAVKHKIKLIADHIPPTRPSSRKN